MIPNHDDPMPGGSTQYNKIADAYSSLYLPDGDLRNGLPLEQFEIHKFNAALNGPAIDVRGKHVLDLACGNGYNNHRYLL